MGDSTTDISHIFDGVAIGNSWIPRITATVEGEQKEQVMFWGIDIVQQEPELCQINIFQLELFTNSTHATVNFDLDCGYQSNELEGYNVSVQFLIYNVNATGEDTPLEYNTCVHYIQGYVGDIHSLSLTNFSNNNTTHYDIYWYATWIDGDGESQMLEEKWLNRELNP